MSKPIRFGSAVSFIALASALAGCASPQGHVTSVSSKSDREVGLAARAIGALNSNDIPAAIDFAERAVAKTPDDAGFRGLLGNAYFAGGRFTSAESAFKDSLAIYPNQPQVVLKLALVEIARGESAQAIALLDSGQAVIDPADYGLALALAGRASDAIPVLETAARDYGAGSRVRQNLALAYAFAGDWTKARTIAAQDVPGNQLDARIQQWMQLAKPAHASDQIAALTGVSPAATDPGQPTRLALVKTDTQVAEAAPAPQVAEAVSTPPAAAPQYTEASVAPDPVSVAAVPPAPPPPRVVAETPAPMTIAMAAAASPEAPAAFAAFIPKVRAAAAKPAKLPRAPAILKAATLRHGNSGPVMQLGAYRSQQYVTAAWTQMTQRYPALRAYLPMRARFDSSKGTFWRLSITGFGNQREAISRCQLLKSHGGNCFVRGFAGDAPVQIASR
jgi:D-alanyl-D-alanine carboxypeptidase